MTARLHHKRQILQSLPWMEPLDAAEPIGDSHWALLHSAAQTGYSGRYSYLALGLEEKIEGDDFAALAPGKDWFGYLGYGLKDRLERLTPERGGWIALPHFLMMRFRTVLRFDHEARRIDLISGDVSALAGGNRKTGTIPRVTDLRSGMTKKEYLEKVARIIERIHAGDLYQANLTRKFMGEFERAPDAFSIYRRLCERSPAPYSAYMRCGDTHILSSSPERFLAIDADGNVNTRPIKGTAPRHLPAKALAESGKDRAENLMIVDLMRNDLARCCLPGSVRVESLFDITTHASVHHMSSAIRGKKRADCTALDVVKSCFPPGSMTGAPKIRAMEVCAELEPQARGVYSGAVGRFDSDGGCDLSVVIRTLIVQENRFEFQVGGGIVADSDPELEFAETMHKARGVLQALGLPESALEAL